MSCEPVSVEQQCEGAGYSAFVEAPANAALYEEYLHYSFFEQLDQLVLSLEGPTARGLDVGCGNGVLSRAAIRRYTGTDLQMTGVDLSHQLKFVHSDVIALPDNRDCTLIDQSPFDFVISGIFFAQ